MMWRHVAPKLDNWPWLDLNHKNPKTFKNNFGPIFRVNDQMRLQSFIYRNFELFEFQKKQRLSNFSRVKVKWGHTTFWIGLILIFIEPEKSYQSSWFLSFLSWKTEKISKNSRTLLDSIHKVEVKSKTQKVNWGQIKFDV